MEGLELFFLCYTFVTGLVFVGIAFSLVYLGLNGVVRYIIKLLKL